MWLLRLAVRCCAVLCVAKIMVGGRLVAVVRADNHALAAMRRTRGKLGAQPWERPEELLAPLRAVNGLNIMLAPPQQVRSGVAHAWAQ